MLRGMFVFVTNFSALCWVFNGSAESSSQAVTERDFFEMFSCALPSDDSKSINLTCQIAATGVTNTFEMKFHNTLKLRCLRLFCFNSLRCCRCSCFIICLLSAFFL